MSYRNEGNCWFYGSSAARPDVQGDVGSLSGGATHLRPGEVVVRVDGGAVIYVMPEDWFSALRAGLEERLESMARGRAWVRLGITALHRNTCELPGGGRWEALTFGNLMGGGSFLAGPSAEGGELAQLAQLAGKKLANVEGQFSCDGVFALAAWALRE